MPSKRMPLDRRPMMRVTVASVLTCAIGSLTLANAQQSPSAPRRISFDTRPIVEHLAANDRHVLLLSPTATPAFGDPGNRSFVTAIVDENPIIFAGRVVEKEAAFMTLRGAQDY